MKLSETLIRKFSAYCSYVGEDFGYAPENKIPQDALPLWCDFARIDSDKYPLDIPYAFFVSKSVFLSKKFDVFYIFIHSTVYMCKSSLHSTFSYDEIVILLYLCFERHQTFEL